MNDKSPASDDDEAAALAGERLAAARRDQEISLAEIAKELHLDEAKVQALEQNKFDVLGAPVFAKGHLRKYAEIVGVPLDDVLADYYQLNRSAGAPPILGPPRDRPRDIDLSRWVLPAVVVIIAAVIAGWWISSGSPLPSIDGRDVTDDPAMSVPRQVELPDNEPPPSRTEVDEAVADGEETADEVSSGGDAGSSSMPADSTAAGAPTEAPAAEEPLPEDDSAGAALPATAVVSVTLRFSGDCWTEITDADGARLFFDLGRAGRRVSVSGTPPLRVLFGSYENVEVTVDGAPYPIPASSRRGETARFTIAAR